MKLKYKHRQRMR